MAILSTDNPGAFIFGLLGNISSFVVFLAPLPTFIRICKKRSTEGFQSVPYVASLFSAMLWMYYAFVKTGAFLLITINAFGCVVETVYIAIYVAFAPKQSRISTLRLLLLMDFGGFCSILLVSQFLTKGSIRVEVLGWICVAFATSVFAAPLSIIRQVIRTKSVEFMPFYLSFFLTVSAITWLCYGVFLKDLYIAIPNVLGFVFGFLQMVLYGIYRNKKTTVMEEVKLPEHSIDVAKLSTAPMESWPEAQDHRTGSYQNQITQSGRHDENNIVGVSCKLENHDHQDEYDQITDDQMEKIILGSNSSANPSQQLVVTCAA